jgi:hypothetical protein
LGRLIPCSSDLPRTWAIPFCASQWWWARGVGRTLRIDAHMLFKIA